MDSYVAPVRFQNFHDSPLDFSTKNKMRIQDHTHSDEDEDIVDVESSPKSKLRNILKKGGGGGGVLNLSKGEGDDEEEEDLSPHPHSSPHSSWSRASSPLSPSMEQQAVTSVTSGDNNNSHLVPDGQQQQQKIQAQMQAQMQQMFGSGGSAALAAFSPWGTFSQPSPNSLSPGGGGMMDLGVHGGVPFGYHSSVIVPSSSPHGGGAANNKKATRPFKAYPKDPMSFPTVGMYGLPAGPEALQQSQQAYADFRKQMLNSSSMSRGRRSSSKNGGGEGSSEEGGPLSSFSRISPSSPTDMELIPSRKSEQQMKDDAYWERRRKNNEAAKRSRDARRAKEDEIAIRAAFLEQENLKLRFELCALKNETAKLRCMLYST